MNDETSFVKLDPTSAERSLEMLKLKLSDKVSSYLEINYMVDIKISDQHIIYLMGELGNQPMQYLLNQ